MMNVVIYCLGEKAFVSLKNLDVLLIPHIHYIVVGKDKNVKNDYSEDILDWANRNNISTFFRRDEIPESHTSNVSVHIAIGWRWLLNIPANNSLIVFHDSLLPKNRGFNPLVTSLINGEETIGVTALFGNAAYDEGDIISQSEIRINYPIKIKDAIEKVSKLYSTLLNQILGNVKSGERILGIKQDHLKATYSLWRDENDYKIDWSKDSQYIARFINAVGYPYLGAYCYMNGKKIRITEAEVYPDVLIANRTAGKFIFKKNNEPIVVCGKGLLKIKKAYDSEDKIVIFENFRIKLT